MAKNAKKETWSKLKITVVRKLNWGTLILNKPLFTLHNRPGVAGDVL